MWVHLLVSPAIVSNNPCLQWANVLYEKITMRRIIVEKIESLSIIQIEIIDIGRESQLKYITVLWAQIFTASEFNILTGY
jgi:hypothetical protein